MDPPLQAGTDDRSCYPCGYGTEHCCPRPLHGQDIYSLFTMSKIPDGIAVIRTNTQHHKDAVALTSVLSDAMGSVFNQENWWS